jgi:transcriptional regulator with XRE-family HTH domain
VRARREEKALSSRALANRIEIRPSSLQNIERGRTRQPKTTTLNALARELGIAYPKLLALAGHPIPGRAKLPAPSANSIGEVTPDEDAALRQYLSFLRWRSGTAPRQAAVDEPDIA